MTTIEILGALGFGLSLAHIGWQIWWQHRQNRERVKAEISLGPNPCIKVHNTGNVSVYLSGVRLIVEQEGTTQKFPLQAPIVLRALPREAHLLGEEQWQLVGKPTYDEPLPRGGAYNFVLPIAAAQIDDLVENAMRLKMRISVFSNAGEIVRLKQKDTLVYLKALSENVHCERKK